MTNHQPHIVIIIPRGESVRNFLYSDTLKVLSENAKVTLLSVIHDARFREQFESYADVVPLEEATENIWVQRFRHLVHMIHFRWLWSGVARNKWEQDDYAAKTPVQKVRRALAKAVYRALAFRPIVEMLAHLENWATIKFRTTEHFHELFRELQPDLVFNTSHVHGNAARLPVRAAHDLGIHTVGFVFSWDNLTSRSRILEPYDNYFVWTDAIKQDFHRIYPTVPKDRVHVTGTPQFDFHFREENWLSREELAKRVGFDASRPFIFYTTGIDKHFPEEHRTVALVIDILREIPDPPQLVVRNYVKGTSEAMKELMASAPKDVYFPPMQWDDQWFMPTREDQKMYTSMLRECVLGINAASTVSLELMLHGKPVINLGFDPPGSKLPHYLRYTRHTNEFDHYIPVMKSGAVMVARSSDDLQNMLTMCLDSPNHIVNVQQHFLKKTFGPAFAGNSGQKIGEKLLDISHRMFENYIL